MFGTEPLHEGRRLSSKPLNVSYGTMSHRAAEPEGRLWGRNLRFHLVPRTAGIGASSSLLRVSAKVSSANPQRPLSLGRGNCSSWGWSAGGMALTARSSHEPTFEANVRFDKL